MKNKIRTIDTLVISGSAILLIILIGYSFPRIIAPINETETSRPVLFSVENADYILIDNNPEFTSPDRYSLNGSIALKPGIYYWKAVGITRSEIRKLTINSEIDLRMEREGDKYNVVNAGNVNLRIDVYDERELVESFSLQKGERGEVLGNKIIGGQDE